MPRTTGPTVSNRAWLITFIDLVSLMLTFFVMLFAMSNTNVDQWRATADSLSQTLKLSRSASGDRESALLGIGTTTRKPATDLDYLAVVLHEAMSGDPLLARIQIIRSTDRLIVALPADLLFESGRAALSEQGRVSVFTLAGFLGNVGNQIGVNGHTDPTPVRSGEYPSNWELSLARAAVVAHTLRRSGYVGNITAFGFSDSRYAQLPALEETQRRALARRVDIVLFPFARGE